MEKNQIKAECITSTQVNIIFNSRLFWRELIYWARVFYNSVFSGIGSAQEVFARLYNVPSGYAYTLRFIFLRRIAEKFAGLFYEYIVILRELVVAVSNGEIELAKEKVNELYNHAGIMAEFLSSIFPSLDKDMIEGLLKTMTNYQIEEINAYVTRDYRGLIELYDQLEIHTDQIADYVAEGIIDLITAAPVRPGDDRNNKSTDVCITRDELNSILDIAMFWIKLFSWFRSYRVSVMADIGSQDELHKRLIQVTVDFGNAMKNFIAPDIIDAHIGLIQEYLELMMQLLRARMSGNIEEMNRVYRLSIDNINKRAEFLGEAFPSLDKAAWRNQLIRLHTNLIAMGGEFLTGNFAENITVFNDLINQAEDMGFAFVEALLS